MGKTVAKIINRFDAGMTNDPRESNFRFARLIKNFDAHLDKSRLIPSRSSEAGDSAPTTSQKQNFAVAIRTGTTYNLFALGVISGTARAEVLMKSLTTGGSNDMGDNGWATPTNNQSSSGSTDFNLFVYYPKTDRIYGAKGGDRIWAFDPDSSTAWNDSERSISYTNIAQGLVHSKDDILYIPYDNKIAKNNNTSWTDEALLLPNHLKVNSICEYGNYLAIGCSPLSGIGNSKVFLWDMRSETWNLQIDWGDGNLQILEEIEGRLMGVSYKDGFKVRMIFREYAGGEANVFQQLESDTNYTAGDLPIGKQKVNNYLYFLMTITIDGVEQIGLWKIGRQSPDKPFSVVMDKTAENDTTVQTLLNFFTYNDFTFISYTIASAFALSKTDNTANYNVLGTYETLKITGNDSQQNKELKGVTVLFEALPSGAKVSLKYKKDEETSFTTIFADFTTQNSIRHTAINIESSGVALPQFKELQLQVLSEDNAVITGIKYQYEEVDDDLIKYA